uniref:UDENN domain-containing protein n=2 Tax=Timema TaxID=61471 RepID=A0A7R9JXF6_TIMGE|nr:unnamed protein product [Timema genevievae]
MKELGVEDAEKNAIYGLDEGNYLLRYLVMLSGDGRGKTQTLNHCERDTNGDVLWTWTYPSVSTTQQSLVLRKCGLEGEHTSVQPFVYGQLGKTWYYINCTEVFDSDNLPRVAQFALVLWAKDFSPEKYETLCRILSKTYCKTGNPATMLQLYLSVVTRGSCTTEENGTFLARDFESRSNTSGHTNLKGGCIYDFIMDCKLEKRANIKFCILLGKSGTETFQMKQQAYGNEAKSHPVCFEGHSCFKSGRTSLNDEERSSQTAEDEEIEVRILLGHFLSFATSKKCSELQSAPLNDLTSKLVQTFGLESILIYTALLLKKRIIVYHHSLGSLLAWVRTFPSMMSHRRGYDYLFPWVDLAQDEILELKSSLWYIAGSRDSGIGSRTDLYDVLVNVPAREITVAPHAKESMVMTKSHRDIAVFMVQLAGSEEITELHLIREIADKTKELLDQLRTLATVKTPEGKLMVSIESIREKNLPPALDNFLFNLAIAENLIML